ncbi:MAG: O-antigen ligase family protein [Gammaproteobacteria bacterium]|nr:O-antigen ligase family protein [Gammaproteobacteria bacterium]
MQSRPLNLFTAVLTVTVVILSMAFNGGAAIIHFLTLSSIVTLLTATLLIHKNNHNQLLTPKLYSPFTFYSLFLLWSTLTYFWSVDKTTTLIELPILYLGLFALIFGSHIAKEGAHRIAKAFIVTTVMMAITSTFLSFSQGDNRVSILLSNVNTYAAILVVSITLLSAHLIHFKDRLSLFHFFALLSLATGIATTQSRAAALVLLSSLLLLFIASRKQINLQRYIVVIATIGAVFILFEFLRTAMPVSNSSWISIVEKMQDTGSLSVRQMIWYSTLDIVQQNPLFGVGHGTFAKVYPSVRYGVDGTAGMHAHNDYLQIMMMSGVIGLLLFLFFVYLSLKPVAKKLLTGDSGRSDTEIYAGIALCGILVHSFFTFHLQQVSTLAITAFLAGYLSINSGYYHKDYIIPIWAKGIVNSSIVLFGMTYITLQALFLYSYILTNYLPSSNIAQETELQLNKAIIVAPYNLFAYLKKAEVLEQVADRLNPPYKQTMMEHAAAALDEAAKYSSTNPYIPYFRAILLMKGRDIDHGLISSNFEEAIKRNPYAIEIRSSYHQYLLASPLSSFEASCEVLEDGINRYYTYTSGPSIDKFLRQILDCRTMIDKEGVTIMEEQLNELRDRIFQHQEQFGDSEFFVTFRITDDRKPIPGVHAP